jgi:hypothetical protein
MGQILVHLAQGCVLATHQRDITGTQFRKKTEVLILSHGGVLHIGKGIVLPKFGDLIDLAQDRERKLPLFPNQQESSVFITVTSSAQ